MKGNVFLIPCTLHSDAIHTVPSYITGAVKECHVFFAENERSARRFLKSLWKEMIIDDFAWVAIHKAEAAVLKQFRAYLEAGKNVGILSEAGCPGIADPGQLLVAEAHRAGAVVKPLVGPSSILLALMASGLNGQKFQFEGYLPVDEPAKIKSLRKMEAESERNNCTYVFIETPYRNNQLLNTILRTCRGRTRLCIAADITSENEWIKTRAIDEWKEQIPDLHKKPAIFCLLAQ